MKFYKCKKILLNFVITAQILAVILLSIKISCPYFNKRHVPNASEMLDLTAILEKNTFTDEDFKLIFQQTGLGKSAVEALSKREILNYQEYFFTDFKTECLSMFELVTYESRLMDENGYRAFAPPFVGVQAGDILLTFSTHTLGWAHGHAALVLDENTILECLSIGTVSRISDIKTWQKYADFIVLRPKTYDLELGKSVAEYASSNLIDIPYSLFSDIKSQEIEGELTAHCSYIVWYAWNEFGLNLDSDKGIFVTPHDIMSSDKVEVIQIFGQNPKDFSF